MLSRMNLARVALLLSALPTWAAGLETGPGEESADFVFKIRGAKVVFVSFDRPPLLVSKSCVAKPQKLECQAATALSRASLKGSGANAGSANPGAVLCPKLKGRIVIGTNRIGGENSFCLFEDGSLVSNGSLGAYALANDRNKSRTK